MKWKRRWKWLILAAVLVISFATWLLVNSVGNVPVDVIGTLPDKDVAEIVALVKQKFRKQILPDFSWRSMRNSPVTFRHYSSMKLFTIVETENNSAMVFIWYNTNSILRGESRYDYWSKKRRSGGLMDFQVLADTNSMEMLVSKRPEGWRLEQLWVE